MHIIMIIPPKLGQLLDGVRTNGHMRIRADASLSPRASQT